MNKSNLIDNIRTNAGITKEQATLALQAVETSITKALANGDTVQMVGFGSFSIAERQARKGRNPKTGEAIDIPAKNAVKFKAGKLLNDAIN